MTKEKIELELLQVIDATPEKVEKGFSVIMNLGNRFLIHGKEVSELEYNEHVTNNPHLIKLTLNLGKAI
jgi:hypothetical protein